MTAAEPVSAADRLSRLFEAHHDRLYRLARRLVSSAEDARDLVQDTFLKAARRLESVPTDPVGQEAWLVRVLINRRRDQWRRAGVRWRYLVSVHTPNEPGPATSPEAAFLARADVWRALDTLTPRRRAVLVLHELEGLAGPDIAALLGISPITVRWHLSRGRLELARILKPRLGATP